jgi:hypothetical protein
MKWMGRTYGAAEAAPLKTLGEALYLMLIVSICAPATT